MLMPTIVGDGACLRTLDGLIILLNAVKAGNIPCFFCFGTNTHSISLQLEVLLRKIVVTNTKSIKVIL